MDTSSIITIVIILAIIYFLVKFVVSPLIKLIAGIIFFLIIIYVLQNYFGLSLNQYLGPFAKYINIDKILGSFSWVINPLSSYVDKAIVFVKFLLSNAPKI